LQIDTDLLLVKKSTTDNFSECTHIDDLEQLLNPESGFSVSFFAILGYDTYFNHRLHQNYWTRTICRYNLQHKTYILTVPSFDLLAFQSSVQRRQIWVLFQSALLFYCTFTLIFQLVALMLSRIT